MATPFPLSVKIGGASPAFVIDAAFALSSMGLLVTMSLARHAPVWLPRSMLNLLDNDSLYQRQPTMMGGFWMDETTRSASLAAMVAELPPWQRAWHFGKLAARVHWIGDARSESAPADREEASLLPRFEHCAASLDAMLVMRGTTPAGPLEDCARDAVAMAAALQPDPVILLTLPDAAGGQPPLCSLLATLGFSVRRRAVGATLTPLFDNALVPLEAGGCDAAMVQVVAPAVLTLPDSWDDADWIDEETGVAGQDLWRHACALWQPLTTLAAA